MKTLIKEIELANLSKKHFFNKAKQAEKRLTLYKKILYSITAPSS